MVLRYELCQPDERDFCKVEFFCDDIKVDHPSFDLLLRLAVFNRDVSFDAFRMRDEDRRNLYEIFVRDQSVEHSKDLKAIAVALSKNREEK